MAGNPEHEDAIRAAHPDAVEVRCDGYVRKATLTYADGQVVQANCPACEREELLRSIGAFLPPRFRASVGLPQKVAEWAARGREAQGLYLTGQVGTGKTHTAWTALGHWCLASGTRPHHDEEDWTGRISPSVIFTRMTDLLDDLRPGEEAVRRIRDCQRAALLVVDDIGAEKASEWTQERVYSVIDHRYTNCMPLIVTSNLPPSKLAGQVGERAASRLAEMCEVVAMTGTDRRRPQA